MFRVFSRIQDNNLNMFWAATPCRLSTSLALLDIEDEGRTCLSKVCIQPTRRNMPEHPIVQQYGCVNHTRCFAFFSFHRMFLSTITFIDCALNF